MTSVEGQSRDIEQLKQEVIEAEEGRFRSLPGALGLLQRVLLCVIPISGILFVANVHSYMGWLVYNEQYVGFFLTLIFVSTFLSTPATRRSPRDRLPWYDALLALVALPAGLYLAWRFPEISLRLGVFTPDRAIFGAMAILLVLEGVRRFAGRVLTIVLIAFIIYGAYANVLPGQFRGLSTPWDRLIANLYLDPTGMLNMIEIASSIAMAFIFFGAVLTSFGGGDQLNQLAVMSFGRFRGGPAKAAVVGSSLVGTMTGGAASNVLITGSVTIPLMIRTGYKPAMAGAVESVASSGGQIMPPVMGVVAFMIAENLGVPYADVALAAFVPAVLFYLACFVQVDLQAGKEGMRGLPASEIPKPRVVLRNAWVVIPCLVILIYTLMVIRMNPAIAGIVSAIVSLPFLLMVKSGRGHFLGRVLNVFEGTGKMLMNIGVVISGAGIIVGVAGSSGLGFNLTYGLTTIGGENLLLLLVLAAGVSVILGMGMPAVPAYALVATLVAPALVKLGILPMAAHLFIFYFAVVSNWTPPVALACFAASTLCGENPNKIGYVAMRLGILAYVVPFLFVYSPALILRDPSWVVILASVVTAVLGTVLLGIALVGYLFRNVATTRRILFFVAGAALLMPFGKDVTTGLIVNGAGFLIAVPLLVWEFRRRGPVPVPSTDGLRL